MLRQGVGRLSNILIGSMLLASSAVACGGTASSSESSEDSDLSASRCKPITTLTCKSGYEPSEDGCLQSRVEGATPYARCVAETAAGDDAGAKSKAAICGGIAGLTCPAGQTCDLDGDSSPGASGVCKDASKAAICGGIGGIRCPAGQTCDLGGQSYPDASGVCKDAK